MKKIISIFCLIFMLLTMSLEGFAQTNLNTIKTAASKKKKKKKNKKSTFLGSRYQDLTTRYNRYFNAKLRYAEGTQKLADEHQDNYEELLPIYPYNGGDGTSINGDLNTVIEKTSTAIQMKPNSKWVDDCYVLLGKAYFLQGEYQSAVESFQYVTNQFDNSIRKVYHRRSKEKIKKQKEKTKEEARKEKEKEKEAALKEKEATKKQKEKERKEKEKEKAKDRKATAKAKEKERKEKEKAKEEARKAAAKAKEEERKLREKEKEEERKAREEAKEAERKFREQERKEREKAKKERLKEKEKNKKKKKKSKTWTRVEDKEKAEAEQAKRDAEAAERKAKYEAEKAEREAERQARAEERERRKAEVLAKKQAAKDEKERKAAEEEAARIAEEERKAAEEEAARIAEEEAERLAAEKAAEEEEIRSLIDEKQGAEPDPTFKKGGLFKHKPAKYEATIWMIRAFIDQKRFGEAQTVLNIARSDASFPKNLAGELQTLETHFYLQQGEHEKAKVYLERAIKNTKKKANRARLHFIMAQLAQKEQNYEQALNSFEKVLKSKPDYDLELNAKLNVVKMKMETKKFNNKQALAALEKMAKDGKNEEHQDKIYFTMAELALANGEVDKANEYLSLSAGKGSMSPEQKAQAFLKLAELNYNNEKYTNASVYYDSTMVGLSKEHEKFEEARDRQKVLSELAKHIRTVELQDSLLRIARMSKAVREDFLDNLISQLEQEAKEKEQQEFLRAQQQGGNKDDKLGQFYFYNDIARAKGYNDFQYKWGKRPLTDNWRLRSKSTAINDAAVATSVDTTGTSRDQLLAMAQQGQLSKRAIESKLPLSKEQQKIADGLVMEGLYRMGTIYSQKINNKRKAKESFNRLLKKYPNSDYVPQTHYSLYLLGENTAQHKQTLLTKYPESVYAKLLADKNYLKELNAKEAEVTQYYEETFALYEQEKYEDVLSRKKQADEQFKDNPFQAKFDLLEAFAIGKMKDKNAYIAALNQVITKHKDDPVKDKAKEILSFLESDGKSKRSKKSIYNYQPNAKHYVIVLIDKHVETTKLRSNLSDFNKNNFSTDKIKVQQMQMRSGAKPMLLLKTFKNATKATKYQEVLKTKETDIFRNLGQKYQYFVISKSNFTQLFKNENVADYLEFFNENYR